jgi:hypothetical protein
MTYNLGWREYFCYIAMNWHEREIIYMSISLTKKSVLLLPTGAR